MFRGISSLVWLVGCLPPEPPEAVLAPIDVDWRGVLTADTQGFALRDDGLGGQAAMLSTTCTFGADGGVTGDEDPSDEAETVTDGGNDDGQDVGGGGGGFVTVATAGTRLYVFRDAGSPDDGVRVAGLKGAVLAGTASGVAFTEDDDGCNLHFAGRKYVDHAVIPLESWACDAGTLAGSHEGDQVVIAGPDEVILVTPAETVSIGDGGSLVAWDDFTDAAYVARRGESWVESRDASGFVRWSVDLGDPVRSLDDLGAREAVAVMVETADGGALRLLDGWTGQLLVDEPTPTVGSLVGARGGNTLGVAIEGEVHLFELR